MLAATTMYTILILFVNLQAWSKKKIDSCKVCGGDNSSCAGCDGVPNSGLLYDRCGVCMQYSLHDAF